MNIADYSCFGTFLLKGIHKYFYNTHELFWDVKLKSDFLGKHQKSIAAKLQVN